VLPIYLDHNSTTPILPEVADAMHAVYRAGYVNPASQHQLGQRARRKLEETREAILRLLGGQTAGMEADRLIFTSGGTEANNLALRGLAGAPPGRIVISAVEHPSVVGPAEFLASQGFTVETIRALPSGAIDVAHLQSLIDADPPPRVVSVMAANNETGVLMPDLAAIFAACRARGSATHVDAVQLAGKLPCDFRARGADALTIAAHKFHGPIGIGALVLAPRVKIDPIIFGGFQQEGIRPGTEGVALAVGMLAALEGWERDRPARCAHLLSLRNRFEELLLSELPDVVVNGTADRLPQTSNLAFLGCDRQELLLALDLAGVCCSTGSACASGSSEPSPVLRAMGVPSAVLRGALRFCFGLTNTPAEGEWAARHILIAVKHLRSRSGGRNSAAPPRQGA
jgi:cysteine desulfurase